MNNSSRNNRPFRLNIWRAVLGMALFMSAALSIPVPAAAAAPVTGSLAAGSVAPDFTLRSANGPILRLNELRGRVVLVNFWATWCRPCLAVTPQLNRLHEKYGAAGLLLLGISVDENPTQAAALANRLGVRFVVLFDTEKVVSRLYEPTAMPSTLLIDRDGRVRYIHAGHRDGIEGVVEDQIRELLAQ